jgi:hypothetical protein
MASDQYSSKRSWRSLATELAAELDPIKASALSREMEQSILEELVSEQDPFKASILTRAMEQLILDAENRKLSRKFPDSFTSAA